MSIHWTCKTCCPQSDRFEQFMIGWLGPQLCELCDRMIEDPRQIAPLVKRYEPSFSDAMRAHYELMYEAGEFEDLCEQFCHEGLQHYTDEESGQLKVFICSHAVLAPTRPDGAKMIADYIMERVRVHGEEGC